MPRDPHPRFLGKSGVGARGDAILQFDDEVARLMATLKDEGIDDNTLVILSSDNGPAVADGYADGAKQDEAKAGHHANGLYRGGKYTDYEGGTRLPFIARWPSRIKPGATSAEPVSLIDLPATAAAITGQQLVPTDAPDSFDMLPALTEGKPVHEFLLFGNPDRKGAQRAAAIREGRWKLMLDKQRSTDRNPKNIESPNPQGPPFLFDLDADPSESLNLAEQNPAMVKQLTNKLEAASAAGFTRPGAMKVEVR